MKMKKMRGRGITPDYNALCKLHLNGLIVSCKALYHPNQHISIDERVLATKAIIGMKQYIKVNPTKWGYKLFVLADSKSGYTWNFEEYTCKRRGVWKGYIMMSLCP